ncbi:hypothetical protein BDZ45DRAFT_731564 [Acephala macrosclerotiorum]|nr:hypothetical protein BDZ45DRAFT_731564 [Acephala macrosclerotiorum]
MSSSQPLVPANSLASSLSEFPLITPPDVGKNTRLIAVCGTTFEKAGNPYEERKVVLDKSICDSGRLNNIRVENMQDLRSTFLWALNLEAKEARLKSQTLLVIIMSHGEKISKGFWLGGPFEVGTKLLVTPEHFREAIGKNDVPVTVMSAACYSGGWTVMPDITGIYAASAVKESHSWPESKSTGRHCGSIWLSALIEASGHLQQDGAKVTFSEYVKTVKGVAINRVDRLADDYGLSFRPQDDRWSMDYKQRTGAPLSYFWKRWDSLRGVRPNYGCPSSNRNPESKTGGHDDKAALDTWRLYNQEEDPEDPFATMTGSLRARFGTGSKNRVLERYARQVTKQAREYASCFPGPHNVASNIPLHNSLKILFQKTKPMTFPQLSNISTQLEFRLAMIDYANTLAKRLRLSELPGFCPCGKLDVEDWCRKNRQSKPFEYILERLFTENIFGTPIPEQGRDFTMPAQYLAIAMTESKWSQTQIDQAISLLVSGKSNWPLIEI